GVAERIGAVLWYSDLHGYTQISDSVPPEQIIPLLNDYADVVVSAVHKHGGDVLKLIGDGTLAIFTGEEFERTALSALAAAAGMGNAGAQMNGERAPAGPPTTPGHLPLHIGGCLYSKVRGMD